MSWHCDCSSTSGWVVDSWDDGFDLETDGSSFYMSETPLTESDFSLYTTATYSIPASGDFQIVTNVTIPEFVNADSSTTITFDFYATAYGYIYNNDGTVKKQYFDFYVVKTGLAAPVVYLYGFQTISQGITLPVPFTGDFKIVKVGSSVSTYVDDQLLWQSTYDNSSVVITEIEYDWSEESSEVLPISFASSRVNDINIIGTTVWANPYLKSITSDIFGATLTPKITSGTYAYTLEAGYFCDTASFTVTNEKGLVTITMNGVPIQSGVISQPFDLTYGSNIFTIIVTAEDGITTATYTLTVNRHTVANTVCTLKSMSVTTSIKSLSPSFSSTTYSYSATDFYYITSKIIYLASTDIYSTITVNGTPYTGTNTAYPLNNIGDNIFLIEVTAEDGVTKSTYTLNVIRNPNPSTVCTLGWFYISGVILTPEFNNDVYEYSSTLRWDATYIRWEIDKDYAGETVTVNGTPFITGSFRTFYINNGENIILIEAIAEDQVSKKTFTLTLTKPSAPSTDCTLSLLEPYAVDDFHDPYVNYPITFEPTFAPDTTEYFCSLDYSAIYRGVKLIKSYQYATVSIDGAVVSYNSNNMYDMSIPAGNSTHLIIVTAEDGITTRTYTINFYRKPSELGTYYNNQLRYNANPYDATDTGYYGYYGGDWSNAYLCELPSGKILLTYTETDDKKSKISVVDSYLDLLTKKNIAGASEYDFATDYPTITYLVPFVSAYDGEVYMFEVRNFYSASIPCFIKLYKNSDKGLSQTWIYQGELYYQTHPSTSPNYMEPPILFVEDYGATIVLFFEGIYDEDTYATSTFAQPKMMCIVSLDGGKTWNTHTVFINNTLTYSILYHRFSSFIKLGNTYIFETCYYTYFMSAGFCLHYTTDFVNWSYIYCEEPEWDFAGGGGLSNYIWKINNILYMLDGDIVYHKNCSDIGGVLDITSQSQWTNITYNVFLTHDDHYYRPYVSKDQTTFILLELTYYESGSYLRVQGYINNKRNDTNIVKNPMYRLNNLNCISLDGKSTYIDCGYSSLYTTPSITLEAWFKFKGTTGKYQNIIFNYTEHHDCFLITDSIGTPIFRLSKMQTDNLTGTPLIAGNTYHIVASASYTSMYLYINGVLVDSKTLVYSPRITNTANFYVGSNGVGSQYLNADLYLAAIYNDCWDEAFVANRYANLSQDIVPANCAMYFDCRTVTNPIIDKSGNGNDGILYGITCDRERVRNMKHYSTSFINDRNLKYKNSNESWGGVLL